ncbi:MAG: carboxypeptidase-like regulatory domain-containing protein, partial [Vicinamibacterales bacterium]
TDLVGLGGHTVRFNETEGRPTSTDPCPVPVDAFAAILDDQPPTVAFTAPEASLTPAPGERINVSVRATDDVGVNELSYSARGLVVLDAATRLIAPASTDRTETFGFNVPLDAVPGSILTLQASTKDTANHTTAAPALELRIRDTVGPTVEITGVSSGQRVLPGARVTAVVSALDTSGIAQIGFAVSGITVSSETRAVTPVRSPVATSFEFVVPAGATSTDRVFLDAFAIDGAGNRQDAARLIVPVADQQPPTVTLHTSNFLTTMAPGSVVQMVVDGSDDLALSSIQLTGTGAFSFTETQSLSTPSANASRTFVVNVPITVTEGATETFTARATDASGNLSAPVSLTLTAHVAATVTLPPSLLMLAGDQTAMTVTLGAPAPAGGVRVDLGSHSPDTVAVTPSVTFNEGEVAKPVTVTAISGGSTQIDALIDGNLRATTTVTVIGGVVRGEVVTSGPGGFTPVAGAQVTVFHGGTPITAVTDAAGKFQVVGVQVEAYYGRGFSVGASDGTNLGFIDDALDVVGGSANVTVILLPVGGIVGTVLNADAATPVAAGAKVDLFEAASPSVVMATVFTDANGGYRFPLLAPGSYIVEASDASGNRGRASAQVTSGVEAVVPVVYLGRGTVTVQVVDGVGNSVVGAAVELRASSLFGSAALRTATTNVSGQATFADVFIGNVSVTAKDAFSTQGGSTSGQITANGQALNLTVQFAPFANLTGTLFRRDGVTKVPGATVTFKCNFGCTSTTTTDANGVYRFEFLPLQAFTLSALDAGTRGRAVGTGTLSNSGQTYTQNLTLLPQGTLFVKVTDSDGNPVNGASVSATSTTQNLIDSLQGTTATVNTEAGRVLLDKLLAGNFTITASASGLNGGASGVLAADEFRDITVQLEGRATIAGTVYEPDGATPAAGFVRIVNATSGQTTQVALASGAFSAPDLRLATYYISAFDSASRNRAFLENVVLSSNGQVANRTLTFVGLGTVQGRVIHPTGGSVGNIGVDLRSLNTAFGGYAHAQTDAAGNFVFGGIAVGDVNLTSGKPSEGLLGESSGTLATHNQTITLDILLQPNAVNLPVTLTDVQNSSYSISTNGGLVGGTGSVFSPNFPPAGGVNQGTVLTLSSGATSTIFPAVAFGTQEDAGREIAVKKDALLGLNVTRKIFVPQTGYFARYLEILQNPTAGPITVDVRVDSAMFSGRATNCFGPGAFIACLRQHYIASTSSGDTTLTSADRWVSLGGHFGDPAYDGNAGTPLGIVFAGAGAPMQASIFAFDPGFSNFNTAQASSLRYGWSSVTVPANST